MGRLQHSNPSLCLFAKSESLTRRSGALQCASSPKMGGFSKQIQLFSAQKEMDPSCARGKGQILIPGCQPEPAFQGFDPTNLPVCRPRRARFCRRGTVEKTSAFFMFPFLLFAVISMANHAESHCHGGKGTANISAEIIGWCVLNAALQNIQAINA